MGAERELDAGVASNADAGASAAPGAIGISVLQPHAWRGRCPVEVRTEQIIGGLVGPGSVGVAEALPAQWLLTDVLGRRLPLQAVPEGVLFVASLEDGRGEFRLRASSSEASMFREVYASDTDVDNMDLRLEIDPVTGMPSSLIDRNTCEELLAGPGRAGGRVARVGVSCVERGCVRSTLRCEYEVDGGRLVQEFRLHRELPWVDVRTSVEWGPEAEGIALVIPTALEESGMVETAGGRDPGWTWVDVSNPGRIGLSLLQQGWTRIRAEGTTLVLELDRKDTRASAAYALVAHAGEPGRVPVEVVAALLGSPASVGVTA